MRKIVQLLLVPIIIFSFSNLVNAEVTEAGKVKRDLYTTTEDILLTLLEPELNNIITEKYGKEKSWQMGNVEKASLIADHTKNPSDFYYELIMAVKVGDDVNEVKSTDIIHIKLEIPNMYTDDKYKEKNSKMKVSLVRYDQVR